MSSRTAEQKAATATRTADGAQPSSPAAERTPIEDELVSLREAIEELRGRQGASEDQLRAVAAEMTSMRGFREHTETELSKLRIDVSALASIIDEFAGLPAEVRAQLEPELADVREQLKLQVSQLSVGEKDSEQQNGSPENGSARDRGRPVVVPTDPVEGGGSEDGVLRRDDSTEPVEQMPSVEWTPPTFALGDQRTAWLADAIGSVALRRSARLAGELVLELIPYQASRCEQTVAYELEIEELGRFVVLLASGHATVVPRDDSSDTKTDFRLRGSAADFAELVAGGALTARSRLRVKGSRRKARQLRRECSDPVVLADLVAADVSIWPGLLLAAMAETVEPDWMRGSLFDIAFEIEGEPSTVLLVSVRDGAQLGLARGESTSAATPSDSTTVSISERGFICMLAGAPLPDGEQTLVRGRQSDVELLLDWFRRAQTPTH